MQTRPAGLQHYLPEQILRKQQYRDLALGRGFYRAESYTAWRSLGFLIRTLHNLVIPRAEGWFAGEELTFTHWCTLMSLRDDIADTSSEIARRLNQDTGAMTRVIDELERRGLVRRTRSRRDRRVVHLALTGQGNRVARAMLPRVVMSWNEVLEGFSAKEVNALIDLMTRLIANLEAKSGAKAPKP